MTNTATTPTSFANLSTEQLRLATEAVVRACEDNTDEHARPRLAEVLGLLYGEQMRRKSEESR